MQERVTETREINGFKKGDTLSYRLNSRLTGERAIFWDVTSVGGRECAGPLRIVLVFSEGEWFMCQAHVIELAYSMCRRMVLTEKYVLWTISNSQRKARCMDIHD